MKYVFYFCLILVALPSIGSAQIPRTLSYQGILTDTSGNAKPDGFYSITFSLYSDKDGGSSFWSETKSLMVKKGLFSTLIGDNTYLPPSVKFDQQYWLGIKVSSDPELKPRVRLSSVAYSLNAEQSRRAIYADTASVAQVTVTDTAWKVSGPDIYRANGNVGIGAPNPSYRLDVTGPNYGPLVARFSQKSTESGLSLSNTDSGGVSWGLFSTGGSSSYGQGNLLIQGNVDAMFINKLGNVGIGTTAPDALFTVRGLAQSNLQYGHHIALFENTDETSNGDGIAIKINNPHTNAGNNFITFYNGSSSTVGRIEGFDYEHSDWTNPPPVPNINPQLNIALRPASEWFNKGVLPTPKLNGGQLPGMGCNNSFTWTFAPGTTITWCTDPTFDQGSFPTLGGGGGTLPSVFDSPLTIGNPPFTFNMPTQQEITNLACWGLNAGDSYFLPLVAATAFFGPAGTKIMELHYVAEQICKDEGVTYGSKGADYAEWLEKENPEEDIRWGEIVGVRGGKISKVTKDAEQVMVVSRAPIVLGNLPSEDKKENYERIAFMGQVHVVVKGEVKTGDYILASGKDDGFGIAVSPEELQVEQLPLIVGRAWEDSKDARVNFVNVVVGVNHEAATSLLSRQSSDMVTLKDENKSLQAELAQLKSEQVRMSTLVEQLVKNVNLKQNIIPITRASVSKEAKSVSANVR